MDCQTWWKNGSSAVVVEPIQSARQTEKASKRKIPDKGLPEASRNTKTLYSKEKKKKKKKKKKKPTVTSHEARKLDKETPLQKNADLFLRCARREEMVYCTTKTFKSP
ncbi:hypothetical protein CDAR_20671 [Caerostris darwini]|uniref:Uncharacterized protein n=1 Tax=Caerostris darwini TaxID=1538125 RepID=A0AAV4QEE1_9ARAC|nr:hypothetical protein CDAR_20671 [Caerostris darwini]